MIEGQVIDIDRDIASIAKRVGVLSISIAQVTCDVQDVAELADHQRGVFQTIRTRMSHVSGRGGDVMTAAHTALESSNTAEGRVSETSEAIALMMENVAALTERVNGIAAHLERVVASIARVAKVTQDVSGIARQTNLLSLNASIEAARAGVHGRGFMVVAGEVKQLSTQAGQATAEIGAKVEELRLEMESVISEASEASQLAHVIREKTGSVGGDVRSLPDLLAGMRHAQQQIVHVASGIDTEISQTLHEIEQMAQGVDQQAVNLVTTRDALINLTDTAEALTGITARLGVETVDTPYITAVKAAARQISALFEQALARRQMNEAELFDETYIEIPQSNPVQHHTKFTRFTDMVLPPIQEKLLLVSPNVVFCAAIDRNGYIPTHNTKFSQPQRLGQPDWNAKHARNRRIFNDRVGLGAGRSERPFLLQAYRRDMGNGEYMMMKDVSAPIIVNGRHWGGLRLAYRID
ncbi:MAG: methyl-accepting chemotaxis protein [Roseinatronobacter sp.]|nr:methyl-accepting chemotaxis protein [Roseinatronobacter sp.]